MSELKAMTVLNVQQMGCYDNTLVYFKSEADKVIAEKDAEIAQLQAMLEERNKQVGELCAIAKRNKRAAQTLRKKMNHHKYKRCLAMAIFCENKLGTVVKPGWWDRWRKCWLELAEKFKEAK